MPLVLGEADERIKDLLNSESIQYMARIRKRDNYFEYEDKVTEIRNTKRLKTSEAQTSQYCDQPTLTKLNMNTPMHSALLSSRLQLDQATEQHIRTSVAINHSTIQGIALNLRSNRLK